MIQFTSEMDCKVQTLDRLLNSNALNNCGNPDNTLL